MFQWAMTLQRRFINESARFSKVPCFYEEAMKFWDALLPDKARRNRNPPLSKSYCLLKQAYRSVGTSGASARP